MSASSSSTSRSTQPGPPSASHAPSTEARRLARRRPASAPAITARTRSRRSCPAGGNAARRAGSCIAAHTVASSAPAHKAFRSASVSPHHGARSNASHAVRSARCESARVSASRSCTTGRSPRGSISMARNASPASRRAGITSSRCLRLRTRIATLAPAASSTICATRRPSAAPSPWANGCTCTALPACGCTACERA